MANSLLTINMIAREAVRLWKNSNEFIQNIDMQYDDQFAQTGAKIGTSLRVRLPNDYTVTTGPALSAQDTAEVNTTLVLATQQHVDVSFSSVDRTMSLDDFSRRVLAPMVNNLAGAVAVNIMAGVEGGVSNYVSKVDGSNNILNPDASTWLQANAILTNNSAAKKGRKAILSPITNARTVASLAGLFNPQTNIGRQYEEATMGPRALGFEWFEDQTVLTHTTGAYSGSLTVNGAGQTGTQITVNAISGGLALGDIVTFAGVNAVNRITKGSTGQLQQFVLTAAVAASGTTMNIYPAIVPPVNGQSVQYQTVTASPANSATITVVSLSGQAYRKNIVFAPEAITMATADLELPKGVHEAAREEYDGVAMRFLSAYIPGTDQFVSRLDVLYGYLFTRPEWCVAVADTSP